MTQDTLEISGWSRRELGSQGERFECRSSHPVAAFITMLQSGACLAVCWILVRRALAVQETGAWCLAAVALVAFLVLVWCTLYLLWGTLRIDVKPEGFRYFSGILSWGRTISCSWDQVVSIQASSIASGIWSSGESERYGLSDDPQDRGDECQVMNHILTVTLKQGKKLSLKLKCEEDLEFFHQRFADHIA